MMEKAESLGKTLLLPVDTVVADEFPNLSTRKFRLKPVAADAIPANKWA